MVRGPRPEADAAAPGALVDLLAARVATLQSAEEVDKVGLSRAHIELAVASEMLGDDARSTVTFSSPSPRATLSSGGSVSG